MRDSFDVVVVGAGAAGLGAMARLAAAPVASVALEARSRIGGRADTVRPRPGLPLDLGCAWLHSADRNPLAGRFQAAGLHIDRSPPAWTRPALNPEFSPEDQAEFLRVRETFEAQLEEAARTGKDRVAADVLEPGSRWNGLLDAISTWYNGAELAEISVLDYAAYRDSGVNWRVPEGYGAALARFADLSRIVTGCQVTTIRHDEPKLRLETPRGVVTAHAVIVTVATPAIAGGRLAFAPGLPDKAQAAAGLPLGLADKVFLGIHGESDLPVDGHLFGRVDRVATASFQTRPYGRPYIDAFLGGHIAAALEAEGPGAMTTFAIDELVGVLGSDWRARVVPLAETAWRADPWSEGSYSHASPGFAWARAVLAQPVDGRIFFAGEATHPDQFSTAHGAWETGVRAAEQALTALDAPPRGELSGRDRGG